MYHVYVAGVEPAGFFKSLSLSSALRGLRPAAKILPGFRKSAVFRSGSYQFATLIWTDAAALRSFAGGPAARDLEALALRNARYHAAHAFVCETEPTREEIVTLWRTARHAAAAA
ncbi:hypothetical protein [Tropicibacter sp. S64]|uniref:hypothetical protein n=1 Tax=Tropicibacter sp. S64 TaxID=3415122 RepID=UPI003C7DDBEC